VGEMTTARSACDGSAASLSKSHNSIHPDAKFNILTGSQRRGALVLETEIQGLARDYGLERLGFLTLTFPDHVTDIREAQRRFNSLNSNVLRKRYPERGVGIWERQKSHRVHFHLVVVLPGDIRTGFDFAGLEVRDYSSAGRLLKNEWNFWRKTARQYRFGRTELLPVKSTADGIARYVGKYLSKHIGNRLHGDKGARVIRFLGYRPEERKANRAFSWNTTGGWLWRMKLKEFCRVHHFVDADAIARRHGPRWAYHMQDMIRGTPLPASTVYPSFSLALSETAMDLDLRASATPFKRSTNSSLQTIPHLQSKGGAKRRRVEREAREARETP
jgi:hypothetical protein